MKTLRTSVLLLLLSAFPAAQTGDVSLYEVTSKNGVYLYKAVVQGCEIFIASAFQIGDGRTVSIATGRGCK